MGYNLRVENNRGDSLSLANNPNYTVYKITGLNPPQATVNRATNATMDGSSVSSVRVGDRNIVIYMTIEGDVEANRINLYKYFPVKKIVTLYFKNGTRDVYINGVVEIIECDLFSNKQVAQVSIICPQPYFKDIEYLVSSFSDVSSNFSFPFSITENGMELSVITPNVRKSIINTGDISTGIIIELFAIGEVVKPVLYDITTGQRIRLNFTLEASDRIVINTNAGEKSISLIRSGVTTNILGYMSMDSEWFVLEAGDNVFTYDCETGNTNLQITFTTSVLYGGV